MKSSRVFALSLAVSALAAFAQTSPPGVEKKASMGGITEYDFPNGLKVLLYPDPANPEITVNVTYLVGSRHEGYGETGMAHLLEHLDFIETTNGRQIKNEITAHATNWNGTTNQDRTNYYETIPATDDQLKWALGLEADRMVNVKFTQQILDTEMTVVRNEFERGENSPQSILRERVEATAYLWHNYGKSTIGSKDDLEHVPVARPAAFYHKYYRPDNAVLTLTGRLDEAKTLQFVADTFGKIAKPAVRVEADYTVEPPQDGERFVELRRVGNGPEVIIAYHGPAAGHPDTAALQVLAGIMNGGGGGRGGRGGRGGGGGGGDEGRLRKALVDSKIAESANMGSRAQHDPGLITLQATLNNDQSLDAAKKALEDALADVIKNPPTKDEIEKVRSGLLKGLEGNLSNPRGIATGALNEAIAQGDWRLMFLAHDRLEDVGPSDVLRVAQAYFKASNRTVGYYIPDAAPDRTVVPATPTMSSLLTGYTSKVTVEHGEVFDPSPANIESRLSRTKLANGMKVVILPKKTEGGMVDSTIELRFGDENTLKGQNTAASFASSLIMRGGTKEHTRQQITEMLRKLDASVNVGGGGGGGGRGGRGGGGGGGGAIGSLNATVNAPAKNYIEALKIAAEIMKEPLYPEESEFETQRAQRIKQLELPQTEPTQLAAETLQKHLTPWVKGDVLFQETREDQIAELKKLTYADVKKFHDRYHGASNGVFAVVGPVDAAAIQKTAADLFGTWNTSMTWKRIDAKYKAAAPINVKIETPDKANAQFESGLRFAMSDSDPDYPAMLLAGYMFGGPITSHVSDRIRNREGLSYGANARVQIPTEGNDAMLSATVSLNPVNGPKVEFSYVDELKLTLKNGFTAAEFASSKKAYLENRIGQRAQDNGLLNQIASHELQGRTMKWDGDLEAKIQALTLDQVNAAFRKHIDASQVSIVKAGDFKAAGVYK